jgi:hypothetical protein
MSGKHMASSIFWLVEENSEISPVLTPSRTQSIANVLESHDNALFLWKSDGNNI